MKRTQDSISGYLQSSSNYWTLKLNAYTKSKSKMYEPEYLKYFNQSQQRSSAKQTWDFMEYIFDQSWLNEYIKVEIV